METREHSLGDGSKVIEHLDAEGNVVNRTVMAGGIVAIGNMHGRINEVVEDGGR